MVTVEIKGPHLPAAVRLFEALARSSMFQCACCVNVMPRDEAAYVEGYRPRSEIMSKAVPLENAVAFVICKVCARLPEAEVFAKAEHLMVREYGLLKTGHKPLDRPGSHKPKGKSSIFGKGGNRIIGPDGGSN